MSSTNAPLAEERKALEQETRYTLARPTLFELSGRDALRYLHGRVTQDVKNLQEDEIKQSLLLSPQGKIEGKFRIFKKSGALFILSDSLDSEQIKEFEAALFRFKVADDVSLRDVSKDFRLATFIGKKAEEMCKSISSAFFVVGTTHPTYTIVVPNTDLPAIKNLNEASPSLLNYLRILHAEPLFGEDLSDKIFATEIPHENYISFNKGCYAGQEFVEMSTARGRPNKKMVVLEYKGEPLTKNADIQTSDGKSVGFITSSTPAPESNSLSLAFIKYSTENTASLTSGSTELTIVSSA